MNQIKRSQSFLISIVTTVLNGESTIEDTISSIASQKTEAVEYLIIDGGSTDRTLEIVKNNSQYIDFWISEKDNGIYDAMNKGLHHSHGKYVWYLNADDYLEPGVIRSLIDSLSTHREDLIYGALRKISPRYSYIVGERNLMQLSRRVTFNHPATLIKRELLVEAGGFDTSFRISADYDLILSMVKQKRSVCFMDRIFANMRHGGRSEQLRYLLRQLKENFRIEKRHVSLGYAVKNLIIYSIPGVLKKSIRSLFERLGLNYIIRRYFENRYGKRRK